MKKAGLFLLVSLVITACSPSEKSTAPTATKSNLESALSVDFGVVQGLSDKKRIDVINNADTAFTGSPVITGPFLLLSHNCGIINPAKKCTLVLRANTFGVAPFTALQGSLTLGDLTVALLGQAGEETESLSFSPSELDLGPVEQGLRSNGIVRVTNSGTGDASVVLSIPSSYLLQSNSCGQVLKSKRSCFFRVLPKTSNLGATEETLFVGSKSLVVKSEIIPRNVSPNLEIEDINLSNLVKGSVSSFVLKITNTGTGAQTDFNLTLPLGFSASSNNCSAGLESKKTCYIRLQIDTKDLDLGLNQMPLAIGSHSINTTLGVIDSLPLGSIELSSLPSHLAKDQCLQATVNLRNTEGLDYIYGSQNSVVVNSSSSLAVYSDASCSTASNSVEFAPYESSAIVYLKTLALGQGSVSLSLEGKSASWESLVYDPSLTISVAKSKILLGETIALSSAGGVDPKVYRVKSGVGATDGPTFLSLEEGESLIEVEDALGFTAEVDVEVRPALTLAGDKLKIPTTGSMSISSSGGFGTKTYRLKSGLGILAGQSYSSNVETVAVLEVEDSIGQKQEISVEVKLPLTLSASKAGDEINKSLAFTSAGGFAPVEFRILSGEGVITQNTVSSATAGTVVVEAEDAIGQKQQVSFLIVNPLTISVSRTAITTTNSVTISSSGGAPTKTYRLKSGTGQVVGQVYTSNAPGVGVVEVEDSLGLKKEASISVSSALALSIGNCSPAVETVNCNLALSGGLSPVTLTASKGSVTSAGVFQGQCVSNSGATSVVATDSMGNSVSLSVPVSCVYKSCNQILAENYGLASGTYWIDPDGTATVYAPQEMYCDQVNNQGGWMLVASNYAGDALIANGVARYTSNYELDRVGALGVPHPDRDYIIGNQIVGHKIQTVRINGYGYKQASNAAYTFANRGTEVSAIWAMPMTITGASQLTRVVPLSEATISGSLHSSALYFALDGIKLDRINGGFTANHSQTTIGGVGIQGASGDPTTGTYLGHGTSENLGSYEGWYDTSGNPYDARGYNTWVKSPYYKLPVSCLDAKNKGTLNLAGTTASGVFTIDPDGVNDGVAPFDVVCNMEFEGGGWTVIQQRKSNSDFYRTWADYKAGFGTVSLTGNYWIGNDRIHKLSSPYEPKQLYIKLGRTATTVGYARYTSFSVGSEGTKYIMHVSGFTGDVGDSFSPHSGYKFTTRDQDNDATTDGAATNCALSYKGGWWYNACHSSNLNGLYLNGAHPGSYADGMEWYTWGNNHYYSMIETIMMIK